MTDTSRATPNGDEFIRDCICADPAGCTVPIPGYRCRRGEGRRDAPPSAEFFGDDDEGACCHVCDGSGDINDCCDDICQGQGYCMHGDGMRICPACKGAG